MTLHDYQSEAVAWMSRRRRALVVSPAGSGKTIIGAAALNRVVTAKPRTARVNVGWVANTIEQCQQAKKAIEMFPEMTPLVSVKIACAAAGVDWSDRQVLVVDEAHHATAPQWFQQINTCQGALWGFTATPEIGDESRDKALLELFGGERFVINRGCVSERLSPARVVLLNDTDLGLRELIDETIEQKLKAMRRWWKRAERYALNAIVSGERKATVEEVVRAKEDLDQIEGEMWAMVSWRACVEIGIIGNQARNDAAVAAALRHSADHTLMLVNEIEHGSSLAERIPGATLCFSKMGKSRRRSALEAFQKGVCRCLIATSLADEGLDLPMANVLVLVSGGRSKAKVEQRTGRVIRRFAGKRGAVIYDFEDLQHPLMAKHSRLRQELYRDLGYATGQRESANLP